MRPLYRTVWIASLLAILGMSCLFLMQPPAMPVVAPMVVYVSDDKSLSLQYPSNWKLHDYSSHAVAGRVAFDPNANTHFGVDTSMAGSLMGDIAKSNNDMLSSLPGMPAAAAAKMKSPLEMLHEASLHAMAKNKRRFSDFLPGATQPMQVGGSEALATEFTFRQGAVWGKKEMTGTYVTILTKEREVMLTATCSQDHAKTLKPVFDRMIASLRFGQGG